MADSLTILGAATSITTLIEVLSKTVIALHTLHTRYASADFTFLNLIAQLTALKAALTRLQEWMDSDIDEVHHQLVMDLEVSVSCCRALVARIGEEIEGLNVDEEGGLDMNSKFKLIVKNGGLEELQRMVDRQTGALGLLLTVCNCKAISDQKVLLEKTSTRKVFSRIRDNSSSLYVQRDSNSLYSRCTDNLSKFSKKFEFDSELLLSKVYEMAFRGTMREAMEKMRREKQQSLTSKERIQNELLENTIKKDRMLQRNLCSVLVLGDQDSAQQFMTTVELLFRAGFSLEKRKEYRNLVMKGIRFVMRNMVEEMNEYESALSDTAKAQVQVLLTDIEQLQAGGRVTVNGVNALQSLRQEKIYRAFLSDPGLREETPQAEKYLVQEIQRIVQPDYSPTDNDLREFDQMPSTRGGIKDCTVQIGDLAYHIIDASSQRVGRTKWITQFNNPQAIAFFVDLSQYDDSLEPGKGKLQENLDLFDFVVNNGWFTHSNIELFLCNRAVFEKRLDKIPLVDCFPDYSGGSDIDAALAYLISRFSRLNRAGLDFNHYLIKATNSLCFRAIMSSVNNNIIDANIRLCGLKPPNTPEPE